MQRRLRNILPVFAIVLAGCGIDYGKVANLDSQGVSIVCFGDSITRGYGASDGMDYPSQLSALIGLPVVNAGRDGDTTESALRRLDDVLYDTRPRVIVIGVGGNDVLKKTPHETTLGNLDAIVARCVEAGSMVVLVHAKFGIFKDRYKEGFEDIAEKRGAVLVENALSGILGRPSRMSDQIHPNDAGYALIAERVAEVLKPLIEESDRRREADSDAAALRPSDERRFVFVHQIGMTGNDPHGESLLPRLVA